jgi:RNA polymerase sigma-70 factor (ECF subfamily)
MLSPPHREIIALIDIAGFGYGEAAEILQVPVGTVMGRITRARGALIAAIDRSTVRPLKSKHGR